MNEILKYIFNLMILFLKLKKYLPELLETDELSILIGDEG